jgi:hypothetical protein
MALSPEEKERRRAAREAAEDAKRREWVVEQCKDLPPVPHDVIMKVARLFGAKV